MITEGLKPGEMICTVPLHYAVEGSPVKVLVVSMYPEDQYAIRALRAGAYGYVNKGGDPQLLVQAVRTVAQGRKYITAEMAQMLVENLTTAAPEAARLSLRFHSPFLPARPCPNRS